VAKTLVTVTTTLLMKKCGSARRPRFWKFSSAVRRELERMKEDVAVRLEGRVEQQKSGRRRGRVEADRKKIRGLVSFMLLIPDEHGD